MKKVMKIVNGKYFTNMCKGAAIVSLIMAGSNTLRISNLEYDTRMITSPEINAVAEAEAFCMTRIETYGVKRQSCSFCMASFKGKNAANCLERADTYFRLDNNLLYNQK